MFKQLLTENTLQDWAYALVAAASFILLLYALRRIALHHLQRVAKRTSTQIDDFLVEVLAATHVLLTYAIGLYLGTKFLNLPATMGMWADRVFITVMILQVGFWCTRGLVFWLRHRLTRGDAQDQGARRMSLSMLSFVGRMVIWVVVVLLIMDNLGINVTALVASLGIGGIAVALALQSILSDLFASLSIAIDQPFVIGDFIVVDDLVGSVEHVGLKTTRIRSLSGEQIILSNNDMLKSRIRNYKYLQERRLAFDIGVTYDTPADTLEQIPALIQQAIETQTEVRFDRAHFKGFGPFSLDFEAVYYVLSPDYGLYMDVQQGINLQLVRNFAKHKVEFAFPTQTLHLLHSAVPGMGKTPATSTSE